MVAALNRLDERRLGLVLVVPALVLMLIVAAYPIANAVWLGFFQYNVKVPDDRTFVGLDNYARILSAPRWWEATVTTVAFTAVGVALQFVIGLAMALVMNRALGRATGMVRVAILVPWATLTVVTALVWKWLFTPDLSFGLLRGAMGLVVDEGCVLCGRASSIGAMVFADTWKTAPFIALLLLAGLQSIDSEMYEAAEVDGAGPWRRFVSLTLPALRPAILVALLFRTLDSMRMFDLAYVMTGGANGTETVSVVAYDHLIRRLNMGLGSAMSVLTFLMILAIAFVFVRVLGAAPGSPDQAKGGAA